MENAMSTKYQVLENGLPATLNIYGWHDSTFVSFEDAREYLLAWVDYPYNDVPTIEPDVPITLAEGDILVIKTLNDSENESVSS